MAERFVIEKGIPIPAPKKNQATGLVKALANMAVGDSMFTQERVQPSKYPRLHPRVFTVSKVHGGYRTWRTA